ncbi:MAG: PKD domain-containing protein [Candidatus Bathyarchaeia archaeon]
MLTLALNIQSVKCIIVANSVSVEPQSQTTLVFSEITVNVTVRYVTDLYMWQIVLYYNSTILSTYPSKIIIPEDISIGPKPIWKDGPYIKNDEKGTYILFVAGVPPGCPGIDGSRVLCQITFTALKSGVSPLTLSEITMQNVYTQLWNSMLETIPIAIFDGEVIVIEPLTVSISPTSASALVGQPVTFTSTVSGGLPSYSCQWFVNGTAVSGATSQSWMFTPTTLGTYIIHLNVTDSTPQTAKSNTATVTVAPQLVVSISPTSTSILVGQSVTFTSEVSGGYTPYNYQWYLNDNPISGAASHTWMFTPTTSGIHYVYLKVTDAENNTAQSEIARIEIATVPVGGYSTKIQTSITVKIVASYIATTSILTIWFTTIKRKISKQNHKE